MRQISVTVAGVGLLFSLSGQAADRTVRAVLSTAPLYNYEDAPATPDADDPAIWVNREDPTRSLVIGTAKDAGLLVYDLQGNLIQALLPPNAPQITAADPSTPGGLNPAPDNPCAESEEGETFGRYNNVDVAYGVRLGKHSGAERSDVAIVSDRGCDRVRFFKIDLINPDGPLVDITSPRAPRVFPDRYDQPSSLQPSGAVEGLQDNPLDDQNTVYGLTVKQAGDEEDTVEVFVSQRERGFVRQLRVDAQADGTLSYTLKRTFLFDTTFELADGHGGQYSWTPCREAVEEEPQSEGLVFDHANGTLYVAFETIGLYKVPISRTLPRDVRIGVDSLVEPITSFGRPYRATPDDDEFECEYDPSGTAAPGDIDAPGTGIHAGEHLQADLEGLSVVSSAPGQTVMLASSQGDSSFHFYALSSDRPQHLGSFLVGGVGETDGVHYVPTALDSEYPLGLLVVQNGEAPEPRDTSDVNGYEFDGATQFKYVDFREVLKALRH